MVSGTKGMYCMVIDTSNDILANVLAQVVKHDIHSFVDWGKNRMRSWGEQENLLVGRQLGSCPV